MRYKQTNSILARREDRDGEMIWSLFVQLLFPLIMVLSFISVFDIAKHKDVVDNTREDNRNLMDILDDLSETDQGKAKYSEWLNIYQKQRWELLSAWDIVQREERAEYYLDRLYSGDRVHIETKNIKDADFLIMCEKTKQAFEAGDINKRKYLDDLYIKILEKANLTDREQGNPKFFSVHEWTDDKSEIPALPFGELTKNQQEQLALVKERFILPANRAHIHNEILKGVDGFEANTVRVQEEVLTRILNYLLENPEELDQQSKTLIDVMLSPKTTPEEREAKANEFYRIQNEKIRDRLEGAGYTFLQQTWQKVASIEY